MRVPTVVTLVLVACGGSNSSNDPDAGPVIDMPGDGDVPGDGRSGNATVRITQELLDPMPATPVAGAKIAVIPPGGAPVIVTTDAMGISSFPVVSGSTVIAVRIGVQPSIAAAGKGHVYVVKGVEPGAMIELGTEPSTFHQGPVLGTLTINFPLFPTAEPTDYVADFVDCGGASVAPGKVTITIVDHGCDMKPRDYHLVARNPLDNSVRGVLTVPGVASKPGTITATGAWVDGITYRAMFAHVDAEAFAAQTTIWARATDWHSAFISQEIVAGSGESSTIAAPLTGPVTIETDVKGNIGDHQLVAEPVTAATTYAIDGATLLPFLRTAVYTGATKTVTWNPTTSSVQPDLVAVKFIDSDFSTNTTYDWSIYAPAATAIVVPDIPDDLTAYDLATGADVLGLDVRLFEVAGASYIDLLADYDHFADGTKFLSDYRTTVRRLWSLAD